MGTFIGNIQKNTREEIRVELDEFKGYDLANIRVWAKKEDGNVIPTKSGLSVRVHHLAELIALLQKAEAAAIAAGVLEKEAA